MSLVLSAALCHASASDVWVVDASGNGDFLDLPPAIAAAADGDTLLVKSGTYKGFHVKGKGLSILAFSGAGVHTAHVRIEDVPAGSQVVLAGLDILAPDFFDAARRSGILMLDNAGSVRLQDCSIEGAKKPVFTLEPMGSIGAELVDCDDVVFVRCQLQGGDGPDWTSQAADGDPGGPGLDALDSRVLLQESAATGGDGGGGDFGGDGAPGVYAHGAQTVLVLVGSDLAGGDGGPTFFIGGPGVGGSGVAMDGGAVGRTRDSDFQGGNWGGFGTNLAPPLDLAAGTSFVHFPGSARQVLIDTHGQAGTTLQAWVVGEPGDRVWILAHTSTSWSFVAPLAGVWTLPAPYLRPLAPQGVLPQSGVLFVPVQLPPLPSGQEGQRRFLQGLVLDSAGKATTTTPSVVVTIGS